ncbi:MAG: hypothetical protein KGM49_00480 [Sphingomonadales bacterium]|nr:hypothetical protein [Sphingomonadales bacterium]
MVAAQVQRDRTLYSQVYHLPSQLARARARVRQLEAQARRLGMTELLERGPA